MFKQKFISITKDFGLNLVASLVTTSISQLVLYPLLAYYMSVERYGVMLTVMGIANTVAVTCGGSLNNTRLLMHNQYDDKKKGGDFTVILWSSIFTSIIVLFVLLSTIYHQTAIVNALVVGFTVLCLIRSYVSVEYRLILDYKKILLSNIFVAVGNLLGIFLFMFIGQEELWPLPFVIGEFLGFIYIYFTTNLMKEPWQRTDLFKQVICKETVLLLTSLSSNLLTYLDRLLLLPLLGGAAVSCYTVASVFGKCLGILMTPLAGVLLSYYAQKGFVMNRLLFWKINLATVISGIIFFLVSLGVSPWFTKLMYPLMFQEASGYLVIANITATINVISNMIQPSVLKFAPTLWQLFIQGVYCLVYLVGGMCVTKSFGLFGFSYVAMIAAIIKVLLLNIVGHAFIDK